MKKSYFPIKFGNLKTLKYHNDTITSMSIFPLGNIISVSLDKSIVIWDKHFSIIQSITNAHKGAITDVCIKDENNFMTCSTYIQTWIKKKNKFKPNKIIYSIDEDIFKKILYFKKKNIISISYENIIIWEETKNMEYQYITIIKNLESIESILLLEDKNLFISSGWSGTGFFNINNFELIIFFPNFKCYCKEGMKKLDNDKIIFGEGNIIKIVSINNKKIIKIIKNVDCKIICVIQEKNIFLIGGYEIGKYFKSIKIYSCNNYQLIKNINCVHEGEICGFIDLNNNCVGSYSEDETIKIWSL